MAKVRKRSLLPDLPVETALLAYRLANIGLIIGAIVVLVSTFFAFWSDSEIKRHDNERIAANEAETARAIADAEAARRGAAEANARASEAELALARYRAGRSLSTNQASVLLTSLRGATKGRVIVKPNFADSEASRYANQISQVFNNAGFENVGDAPLDIISLHETGIFLAVRDEMAPAPHAAPIIEAFERAGIPLKVGHADWVPDPYSVVIVVAKRP